MPAYGGMMAGYTASCLNDLVKDATVNGLQIYPFFLFNESLITRARNYIVDEFLRSDCTHLLFIDSDIVFRPIDVWEMAQVALESDKDIVCGAYPKKNIAWEKVKRAVDKGIADKGKNHPDVLTNYTGDFVFSLEREGEYPMDKPFEVKESGTGFMLIRRDVFEKIAEANPDNSYIPDHPRTKDFDGSREITAFFLDPLVNKRHLSEDYYFCMKAKELGLKVWLCPWIRLHHVGTYVFVGNLPAIVGLGLSTNISEKDFK